MTNKQKERNLRLAAALRGGEYKRGSESLCSKDGHYCCLGVACVLLMQEGVLDPLEIDFEDAFPPAYVAEYYGWETERNRLLSCDPESCDPDLVVRGLRTTASAFNDAVGREGVFEYSWNEIANGFIRLTTEH